MFFTVVEVLLYGEEQCSHGVKFLKQIGFFFLLSYICHTVIV